MICQPIKRANTTYEYENSSTPPRATTRTHAPIDVGSSNDHCRITLFRVRSASSLPMTDSMNLWDPPEQRAFPKGSRVKLVRSRTIKCPPLTESEQKWFDSLWSYDSICAAKLYAQNFKRFKAEEVECPSTMFGIDRGRYKGEWDLYAREILEMPLDSPLSGALAFLVMSKFDKKIDRGGTVGYGNVWRALHWVSLAYNCRCTCLPQTTALIPRIRRVSSTLFAIYGATSIPS